MRGMYSTCIEDNTFHGVKWFKISHDEIEILISPCIIFLQNFFQKQIVLVCFVLYLESTLIERLAKNYYT
jgi:hypothetical protein